MLEFLTANFNLPTVLGAVVVFGGTGWLLWRHHKSGGSCSCGGCSGGCCGHCHSEKTT